MDKTSRYRTILMDILMEHASFKPSHGSIDSIPLIDPNQNNFVLLSSGWDRKKRIQSIIFHFRLGDGKVWVEWDGTSPGATEELIEAGVDKADVVQAWLAPDPQPEPEMALA